MEIYPSFLSVGNERRKYSDLFLCFFPIYSWKTLKFYALKLNQENIYYCVLLFSSAVFCFRELDSKLRGKK